MTHYVLRDDISYCQIGQRLVFLDIGSDRYFHLPCPLEQALTAYLDDTCCSAPQLDQLIERAILVEQPAAEADNRPPDSPPVASRDTSRVDAVTV